MLVVVVVIPAAATAVFVIVMMMFMLVMFVFMILAATIAVVIIVITQQCENAGAILQLLETKGISISLRTYYVHRDEAIEVLSSILWGYTSQDCEKITNLLTPD